MIAEARRWIVNGDCSAPWLSSWLSSLTQLPGSAPWLNYMLSYLEAGPAYGRRR